MTHLAQTNMTMLEIGAHAVGAKNDTLKQQWDNRPICCTKQVSAFDEGAYICTTCEQIFE